MGALNRTSNVKIVNVVMTADLRQSVDLIRVSNPPHVEYNQYKYQRRVAYLNLPSMEGRVTIFNTGKLISVGTKSLAKAKRELSLAVKYLASKRAVKSVSIKPKLRNIVISADLSGSLDIKCLYNSLTNVVYEPEVFPWGIYKPDRGRGATALLFSSGKVVIAGATTLEECKTIVEELRSKILDKYRSSSTEKVLDR